MKKIFLFFFLLLPATVFAQSIREDFDSNTLGWNEFVGTNYSAVIQDGVLRLETRENQPIALATCYSVIDPQKSFEIKAGLVNTKINDEERGIGIVFNYLDDYNFDMFILSKDRAYYQRWIDNKLVGFRAGDVKITKRLKDHVLSVKSSFNNSSLVL